jgi:hypothetical protein
MIYNLKQKAYKLEFALKRKENELKYNISIFIFYFINTYISFQDDETLNFYSKLKNDIKTTNLKELAIQNERLRLELNKLLINDGIIGQLSQRTNGIHETPTGQYKKVKYM